ncbi:protein bangles and beads isoform X2 [Venturia canescens]|uniref:protein bangles and beads isoform X2 n=1 Tax=Venturia canescens TaxID=32260 RepID=UPI001C9D4292|nr:protein bangles and beads isoform X2 [Venturia canescens]
MNRQQRVKVDVHINNGSYKSVGNGNSIRSDSIKDSGSGTEHAYEQICIRPEENDSVNSSSHKKLSDDASESGRSRTVGRRFSRSSSGSDSSNMSSELHCYSSTTSTPSLSRNSSNERVGKLPKVASDGGTSLGGVERKNAPIITTVEIAKESKAPIVASSIVKPPPPPPPPPPPDPIEDLSSALKNGDFNARDEKREKNSRSETSSTASSTANKSEVSLEHQPEVQAGSTSSDTDDAKASQVSHLVSKHMVLPFIPPKFNNTADSNTLLKPSEYLKSICKSSAKNSLSKARSVDNLDIQSRPEVQRGQEPQHEETARKCEEAKAFVPGPPPPPLPPASTARDNPPSPTASHEPETPKTPQPLATISIQDLTSVQLRRTNIKMHATKTFSAPPPRSVSMTNVSEPFFVQKTDLIAELKKTKDIPGIKKLKVERAKSEKTQEQNMITEISKAFSVSNFVDQIPEKDSSGNVIPIWKRQMLARKAAERAKKELEEQIARENEEKRQKAIPPWKRQLLAKKDVDEKKPNSGPPTPPVLIVPAAVKIEISPIVKRDASPAAGSRLLKPIDLERTENEEKKSSTTRDENNDDDEDEAPIIPWRAQLRKTNSKLNIID